MSDAIIRVENLSKSYIIGHKLEKGDTGLRHVIESAARAPLRWMRSGFNTNPATREEFWALRDVSFDVNQGEVVGIIGRNGAGKSTLLKLLSRITEPTQGRVRLRGRVASLLEVGTGFHPELTGRENIYLNGAILGMGRQEIKRKFDEIVDFASIEKFLDTPVKRYSSGMYVRLAFAVAAHLEPEILVVDEVLAVGDADFQKKCLDKMDDVGHSGRTVLFVSHNMQSIVRLCDRCILLDGGQVAMDGPSQRVASKYLSSGMSNSALREWPELDRAPGDDVVRLCAVRIRAESGKLCASFDIRRPFEIELEYEVLKPGHIFHPHFGVSNEDGVTLFVAQDVDQEWRGRHRPVGRYVSTCSIPGNLLAEGGHSVETCLMTLAPETIHAHLRDLVFFRVVDDLSAKDTSRGEYGRPVPGVMRPMFKWTTQFTPKSQSAGPKRPEMKAKKSQQV